MVILRAQRNKKKDYSRIGNSIDRRFGDIRRSPMAVSVLKTNTKLDVMRGGGARFVENLKVQLRAGK